jgi:hypothetical protein
MLPPGGRMYCNVESSGLQSITSITRADVIMICSPVQHVRTHGYRYLMAPTSTNCTIAQYLHTLHFKL